LENVDLDSDEIDYKTYHRAKAYRAGIYSEETYEKIMLHKIKEAITKTDVMQLVPHESKEGYLGKARYLILKKVPIIQAQIKATEEKRTGQLTLFSRWGYNNEIKNNTI
ncbi:hypothetical protein HZB88_02175, partial [archaeon]|nr:hypothetical protein [archaeon]